MGCSAGAALETGLILLLAPKRENTFLALHLLSLLLGCICVCVHAACVRVCRWVHACVQMGACMRACVRACVQGGVGFYWLRNNQAQPATKAAEALEGSSPLLRLRVRHANKKKAV